VILLKANGLGCSRLGLVVGKKTGGAVERNRVKRRLREFFRLHKGVMAKGYDIVIVARKGAAALSFREVNHELGETLLSENRRQRF
jgi:ribonuclease P protein component